MTTTTADRGRWAATWRHARLLPALAAVACMGDCEAALSESARNGTPQVILSVSKDAAVDAPIPAVIWRDTVGDVPRAVRILADSVRFRPAENIYLRKTVYGVTLGEGAEVREPAQPAWTTRDMYTVSGFDNYVVLDSFDIAPGVAPGSAYWDSDGADIAFVQVQRKVLADSASSAYHPPAYTARWVPARRR